MGGNSVGTRPTNRCYTLWLACYRCNKFKGDRTHAQDAMTEETVPLFNPRTQNWHEDFQWNLDGTLVEGITPCGRVTVELLQLNNDYVVEARQFWIIAGWHPPDL